MKFQKNTDEVPTLKLIKELEAAGRIKVLNKDDWRSGQAQFLIINDTSQFDWITGQIENIETMFRKEHPEYYQKGLDLLVINLGRIHRNIKNENDRFVLNEKTINAMMRIRYQKEDKDLISDLGIPRLDWTK